jgi:hypothetical protein
MEAIRDLPDDIRLEIYESIIGYATTGELKGLKPMAKVAFNFIKTDIDRDMEKYMSIVQRNKVNGRNGGRKKKETQMNPKNLDYDNDYDNENKETLSIEREKKSPPPEVEFEISEIKKIMLSDEYHIQLLCRNNQHLHPGLTPEDVAKAICDYFRKLENEGVQFKSLSDAKSHFARWWRLELGKKEPRGAATKLYSHSEMCSVIFQSGGKLTTDNFEKQEFEGKILWAKI